MTEHRLYALYKVLVARRHTRNSLSSSVLSRIGVGWQTLDISRLCHGNDTVVLFYHIFKIDIVDRLLDCRAAFVSIFSLDFKHLGLDYLFYLTFVGEYAFKLRDKCVQTVKLVLNLLSFHAGKTTERHFNYRLCLYIGKTESLHQGHLGRADGCAGLHYLNDFIYVVKRDLVALVYVRSRLCLFKIKLGAATNYGQLMLDIVVKYLRKVQYLGLLSNDCQKVCRAGILKLREFVELIKNYLSVSVTLVLDNYSHSVSARFVAQVGNAIYSLFLYEICN